MVQGDLANGNGGTPVVWAGNGSFPWGAIPGISGSANFIGQDTLGLQGDTSSSDAHYAIFRSN